MRPPEFKLDVFKQDVSNLTSFLDQLGIMYELVERQVEFKAQGEPYGKETVKIPRFLLEQFFGRLCLIIEELQSVNVAPDNEGLVAHCPVHGSEAKFIYFNDRAICLVCLCEQNLCEANWIAPEGEEQ